MPTATEKPFTPQTFNAMEGHPAIIARWVEARNFGFAKLDGIEQNFFIHLKHFPPAERSQVGQGLRILVKVHYQTTSADKPSPTVYGAWIDKG